MKEEKKPKLNRGKKIAKIRAEINKVKTLAKNLNKSWFFEKMKKL